MCMFTMSLWAIITATIAITSKHPSQILAARVLNCKLHCRPAQLDSSKRTNINIDIYIGMELAVVPIYQSEITPEKSRGFVVATYQISLYVNSPPHHDSHHV
jgi:SP family sugar:H+ symporter-like MFS transporter